MRVSLRAEVTGPTDGRGLRASDEVEDRATDEVSRSVLLRLAPRLPAPAHAPDSLPPIRTSEPPAVALPPVPSPEEQSTGLFESWDWDEPDPYETGEFPIARAEVPERSAGRRDPFLSASTGRTPDDDRRPSLAIVQSLPPSLTEDEYLGVRASPAPQPPRPAPGDTAWPPRAFRPAPEVPPWVDLEREVDTQIVIDPTLRPPGPSPLVVAVADAAAWAAGFVATFATGAITTTSALIVLFALSVQ